LPVKPYQRLSSVQMLCARPFRRHGWPLPA
jgi:hypothetical protein